MIKSSILAALAAITLAAPVAASKPVDTVSVTVLHGDLNLADAKAQRRLESRVRSAINKICTAPRFDLRAARHAYECRTRALAAAEAQVRTAIALAADNAYRVAVIDGKPEA